MQDNAKPRVAVVLFNLGGPDQPEAIRPFLLNLFRDPAILRVPFFVRPLLAWWIARARVAPATANYALLGGRSPLLDLTKQQANALERELTAFDATCFIAMRYWHPFSDAAVRDVAAWRPDHVVLLPLYPQYSTTTTGSSLTVWREAAARHGLVAPVSTVCCYFDDVRYADSVARLVTQALASARVALPGKVKLRVLFSAHGLPETIVRAGDPYQYQIERTTASVLRAMSRSDIDWRICYQSRATPQKWLEPSAETEIERAAHDKVALLVVPIAFVSEHSETLVELDVEYRDLANRLGVPGYFRVPTPNADPTFIGALADLVRHAIAHGPGVCTRSHGVACLAAHTACPLHRRVAA
ncbi:MAG TPA: ferrochelatase [Acetobacteraceae bacterium]|nr:ferrochelatase [Acetobacteraceae bacterium]